MATHPKNKKKSLLLALFTALSLGGLLPLSVAFSAETSSPDSSTPDSSISPSTAATKTLPVTDLAHRYRDTQLNVPSGVRYFSKPVLDQSVMTLIQQDPSVSYKIAQSTYMLLSGHLSYAKIVDMEQDADFSNRFSRKFLSALDPAYIFFTPSDVQHLSYQPQAIWRALKGQDFSWVHQVVDVYKKRLHEKQVQAEKLTCDPSLNPNSPSIYLEPQDWTDVQGLHAFACHQVVNHMLGSNLSHHPTSSDWLKSSHEWKASFVQSVQEASGLSDQAFLGMFLQSYAFTVDPHSMYLPPADKSSFQQQLNKSYEGVGIAWVVDQNEVVVTHVFDGSSASKAGLLPGDRLIGMISQGKDKLFTPKDDIGELFDQAGARFALKFKRDQGEVRVALLEKGKINITNALAQAKVLDVSEQKVLLLTVPLFYQDILDNDRQGGSVSKDLRRMIETHTQEQPIDMVVLDLRGNGGGLLAEASSVLGLFMEEGTTAQLKTSSSKAHILPITPRLTVWSGPLVVLVDKASASASEIVASSLQDHKRALIVGQQTYGKGSAQTLFDMDAMSGLPASVFGQINLTTMVFHRPHGEAIQGHGVIPDVVLSGSPKVYGENKFGHMIKNNTQEANLTANIQSSWLNQVPRARQKILQDIKQERWYALWEEQQTAGPSTSLSLNPQIRSLQLATQKQKATSLAWMLSEEEEENPVFKKDVVLQYGVKAGQEVFFSSPNRLAQPKTKE